ncbi:MAG: hypothetical protein ACFBZ9_06335 [Sphingomonadales bacterium]
MKAKTDAEMARDWTLKRMGKAPLCFTGALLVEACAPAEQEVQGPHCQIAVYETETGFVGHIQVVKTGQSPFSFAEHAKTPQDLRQWITAFDPVVALDGEAFSADVCWADGVTATGIAQAGQALRTRVSTARSVYDAAAQSLFSHHEASPRVA